MVHGIVYYYEPLTMNNEPKVQVSDTTMLNRITNAGNKRITIRINLVLGIFATQN